MLMSVPTLEHNIVPQTFPCGTASHELLANINSVFENHLSFIFYKSSY